jgi:signal transduction histidine kinase
VKPYRILLFLFLCHTAAAEADTWEQATAMRLSQQYRNNESRLIEITSELARLPIPYRGETTATGGFLPFWLDSPEHSVTLDFEWSEEVSVDAIALFPLRLYLPNHDSVTDNAYWPGQIEITSFRNGQWEPVALLKDTQKVIRRSLPELVQFETIQTKQIRIVCTDLGKETTTPHYAAGFAEIFIFAGAANIAPLAEVGTTKAREDKVIFSKDFLTDEKTPLGLPEIRTQSPKGLGIYFPTIQQIPKKPYVCEISFEKAVPVDAVRLDPAIIHKAGQGFPVRFSIELLGSNREVLEVSNEFRKLPLPNPGLNPYIARFPETTTNAVRLTIAEVPKRAEAFNAILQLAEITPMHQGVPVRVAATFEHSTKTEDRLSQRFEPTAERLFWTLPTVYDGMTQAGKLLSHREWIEGLSLRKGLLEERHILSEQQVHIANKVRVSTLWGVSLLTLCVIATTSFVTIRSKQRARREVRQMRARIASDLHDETGSSLAAIAMHATQLRAKSSDPKDHKSLNAILRLSKESVFGLREVLHTTAPSIGRAQNILTYMQELAELILGEIPHTIENSRFDSSKIALDPQLRKDLILFYKEALSNCQKHSQCGNVAISLANENGKLTVTIKDDGVGMTYDQLARPRALRTLKQRAARLNGELKIESRPGTGLHLELVAGF